MPLLLVSHEASDSVTVYKIASLPVLPGDYNDDRVVDAADYVVWRKKSGTRPPSYPTIRRPASSMRAITKCGERTLAKRCRGEAVPAPTSQYQSP